MWGDRVFLTTAVGDPKATLKPGLYGDVDSVKEDMPHEWHVICLDKNTGKLVWEDNSVEDRILHGQWSTPAVVLGCFRHGGLAIVRSLGRLGVPVYAVHAERWTPAFFSKYCRKGFLWELNSAPAEESFLAYCCYALL